MRDGLTTQRYLQLYWWLATWALTLRTFKVCYWLLIVTWSRWSHLDLGKRLEWTFLILFIPVLCCIRYQVWWERKGNWLMLMCVLPLIIAEVYLLKFAWSHNMFISYWLPVHGLYYFPMWLLLRNGWTQVYTFSQNEVINFRHQTVQRMALSSSHCYNVWFCGSAVG